MKEIFSGIVGVVLSIDLKTYVVGVIVASFVFMIVSAMLGLPYWIAAIPAGLFILFLLVMVIVAIYQMYKSGSGVQ